MAGFDGTGPRGKGPGTGGQRGRCRQDAGNTGGDTGQRGAGRGRRGGSGGRGVGRGRRQGTDMDRQESGN